MPTSIHHEELAHVTGGAGKPLGRQPDPDPAASCKYGLDEQYTVRTARGRLLWSWTTCKPKP